MLFAILRFLHIISGIVWGGGAVIMFFAVLPSIAATGDSGKQFAAYLFGKSSFTKIMLVAGLTTVLAGSYLYGVDSNWFQSAWMQSSQGMGFGIGASAGIVAFVFGFLISKTNQELGKLGAQIQGAPTPEQRSALDALQKRLRFVATVNIIFILLSIGMMASARMFR